MAITTYAELKAGLADWLLRDDLTAVIPTFISLAEAQMSRSLAHWRQETRSVAEIDARYSELPADWLSPIRLSVSTTNGPAELAPMQYSEMLRSRTGTADEVGVPRYYSISAGSLEIYPTPSGVFDVTMIYRAAVPTLTDADPKNWLLTYAPDAYLYGSLLQAAPYLSDDDRIGVWGSLYEKAISGLNADSEKAKHGGSGQRIKIRSY
jgi:hypothetical protein